MRAGRGLRFWSAVPLLLPQGLWLRATATRLDPPGGATSGTTGSGAALQLLVLGDSVVEGIGAPDVAGALGGSFAAALAERFGRQVAWDAIGRSGARVAEVHGELLPTTPDATASFVLVSVGLNDVTGLTTLAVWRRRLEALLEDIMTRNPGCALMLAGVPPLAYFPAIPQPLRSVLAGRGRAFDAVSAEVVGRLPRGRFVATDFVPDPDDFAPDGYHPGPAGYRGWSRQLAEEAAFALVPHPPDQADGVLEAH
ncbi:MAG: SGNH/GDSL hydrolase family protein [Pseudomonadota bacterium]